MRGVRHDNDGVVLEHGEPRRKRRGPPQPPRALTAEEKEELEARERHRERRAVERARHLAVLETLVPSLPVPDDARVQSEPIIPIDARTGHGDLRAKVERPNGSELRATAKHYDGIQGGRPKDYLHLSVWWRARNGERVRSRGCAIDGPAELRAVAKACTELADEMDRSGNGGT